MEPKVRVGVLIKQGGRILLVRHKKRGKSYWLPPGGGLVWGETLRDCAERELEEELGVKIELLAPQFICESIHPAKERHILHILFSARIVEGRPFAKKNGVLEDFGFFSEEELSSLLLYPAGIKEKIIDFLKGRVSFEYLGNLWR